MQVLPRRRVVSLVVCAVIVMGMFAVIDISLDIVPRVGAPPPRTIYVDDDAPNDPWPNDPTVSDPLEDGSVDHPFDMIQEGIDAAISGDTVCICPGTYVENVFLNMTIDLVGDSSPEIEGIITVQASNCLITELEISGGIDVPNGDCTIDSNTVSGFGIRCYSNGNNFTNNNIFSVLDVGIYTQSNSIIRDNTISYSDGHGIDIEGQNVIIDNNTISNSGLFSIHIMEGLSDSQDIIISNNTMANNAGGVGIYGGSHIQIYENKFQHDVIQITGSHIDIRQNVLYDGGVDFFGSQYIDMTDCQMNGNAGLTISSSTDITVSNCQIDTSCYGCYLTGDCANNLISHNNIIKNDVQAIDDSNNGNQWDSGLSGGNFWSDYNGSDFFSGPNQDIPGSDSIGDTPYVIDSDSQDNYPLMEPLGDLSFLREGWNLVSVPWVQASTQLEDVLFQINGSYDAVGWYNATDEADHWKCYHTSKPPYMNDLHNIDHTMGFGIHITEPGGVVFEFNGTPPTQNQTIDLYKGWNMVGYPSLSNKYRPDALNNLVFGTEVDAVWTYNSGAQKWEEVGDLNYFVVGKGYWIHATQDCVWEVPL